jgi:hypothetical protein
VPEARPRRLPHGDFGQGKTAGEWLGIWLVPLGQSGLKFPFNLLVLRWGAKLKIPRSARTVRVRFPPSAPDSSYDYESISRPVGCSPFTLVGHLVGTPSANFLNAFSTASACGWQ